MQKNVLIIGVVLLIVGLGIGYAVGVNTSQTPQIKESVTSNTHVMTDTMADMNAELEGKTGDSFDKAFISEMIVHHEGAVAMAELALANARHQEIKDLARAIITAQNKEITDMRAWEELWYGDK